MKIRYLFALFLFFFASCDGINWTSSIPDRVVYLSRNLSVDTDAFALKSVGAAVSFTTQKDITDRLGYGGLLVIYGFDMNYYAFDLACPNEVNSDTRVVPNGAGQAVCPVCGSKFSIGWGTGGCVEGVAKEGLRKYNVIFQSTVNGDILRVYQ